MRCGNYQAQRWPDALRHTAALWHAAYGEAYGGYVEYVEDELACAGGQDWDAQLRAHAEAVDRLELTFDNAAEYNFEEYGYQLRPVSHFSAC